MTFHRKAHLDVGLVEVLLHRVDGSATLVVRRLHPMAAIEGVMRNRSILMMFSLGGKLLLHGLLSVVVGGHGAFDKRDEVLKAPLVVKEVWLRCTYIYKSQWKPTGHASPDGEDGASPDTYHAPIRGGCRDCMLSAISRISKALGEGILIAGCLWGNAESGNSYCLHQRPAPDN